MYYSKAQLVHIILNKSILGVKKCEVNMKQHCKWVVNVQTTEAKKLFIKNPVCRWSVSVDKRDTMCKKIEVIFTGLGFHGITKMQQYL